MSTAKIFAEHTTARVGGPAAEWVTADTEAQALEVLQAHPLPQETARAAGQDSLLVLGGGSNLLVADAGFSGTVLQLAFTGITAEPVSPAAATTADAIDVTVAAGHSWDAVVAWTVERGLTGLEALSGIPGAAGAVPVQNVGAYGAEVAQTILDIRVWDRAAADLLVLSSEDLAFGYRDSALKRTTIAGSPRYVVLSVRFRLTHQAGPALSAPVRYAELARSLGLDPAAEEHSRRAPLTEVRQKVLALRAGKGMVLDRADQDTWSTGSFFTNPIIPDPGQGAASSPSLPESAPRFPAGKDPQGRALVKLSAAWLIENAGCGKGFGAELTAGRASLSTKHTLAVTNRGGASTEDLLTVARAARDKVRERFGIILHPEPVLIGCSL
ncbi:UDP-N-acetylmuramate dehydrogenase [Nesterenkonia alkaliphila]|uniref:UDP-N-acetylenolpyruvoylglucosamine reductase n=1 Tax=Nesterenkonia alkaliphila TaxID=1463631 RepID=A0A7K1UL71_9MICC|nr:UDP-N-acetylmuramate dehydrogenase [Nesterenkonia alkaliphila]MVT27238.1 UDP-N-acetylmuramate dehydrogenase [Nesterenkonia alkaliphila]GFZ78374.1 UDP-N-acetylenolpyruvoylglucosamine reductase [Nesterenkonia alkaliphila]